MESKDNLVAKIDIIRNDSFIAAVKHLKKFVLYDQKYSVDTVIAELPEALAEMLQLVMNGPEEEYHFSKTGHLCILFDHIQNRRKIPTYYTSIEKYQKILKKAKKDMKAEGKSRLYQLCTAANKDDVTAFLEKEGFEISYKF